MFYIGSNVMDWPVEAQRGLQDGHQICVRKWLSVKPHAHPINTLLQTHGLTATVCGLLTSVSPVSDVLPSAVTALTNSQAFSELWYSECCIPIIK